MTLSQISIAADKRIPEAIAPLLETYLRLMNDQLPGFLQAFYLHGSVALGAFDPASSDIDFVAVISRPCSDNDFASLEGIHEALVAQFPNPTVDGSYLQATDLGKLDDQLEDYPYINHGIMGWGKHDGNWVTWWMLKNRAVAIMGDDPQTLPFAVDWDDLIAKMLINLNTYWKSFTQYRGRMIGLLFDYEVQWTVLGTLRQYYTFQEHTITSKVRAGEYGIEHLPQRWHRIIQEALTLRKHGDSSYKFAMLCAAETARFLTYIIDLCNSKFT